MSFVDIAIYYRQLGYSVIPIDHNKRAIIKWKEFQECIMTDQAIRRNFSLSSCCGIAVVCGNISGSLEVLDIDQKNDPAGAISIKLLEDINSYDAALLKQLVIAATRNEGKHLFYRCPTIESHCLLAHRPSTMAELEEHPEQRLKILIEKLGEGNYVVVAPSPGYTFVQLDLTRVPLITAKQRDHLLNISRAYNQDQEKAGKQGRISNSGRYCSGQESPFNDYDQRGDVLELLQRHGWILVRRIGAKTFLRRPGETDHDTSADFNHELCLFGVMTTSTAFKRKIGYRPCAVFAILECNGDFRLAARTLLAMGYGIPYKQLRSKK